MHARSLQLCKLSGINSGVDQCGNHSVAVITEEWLLHELLQETKEPQREKRKWDSRPLCSLCNSFNKTLALVLLYLSDQFNTILPPCLDYVEELSVIKCQISPTCCSSCGNKAAWNNRHCCLGCFCLNNSQLFRVCGGKTLQSTSPISSVWVMWRHINNCLVKNVWNVSFIALSLYILAHMLTHW